MAINADTELDTKGLRCPEPLMVLRNRMMDLEAGQIIKVVATDPSTSRDFANYCKFLNHEMLDEQTEDDVFTYWIKKGGS